MSAAIATTPVDDLISSQKKSTKLPSSIQVGLRRIRYEILAFVRETPALVFNFGYPCLMYLIFVASGIIDLNDDLGFGFEQYFLPGMIATGILVGTVQELGIRVVEERENSMLKRLRTSPTTPMAYVIGKLGQVTIMVVAQNVLLLLLAVVGYGALLPQSGGQWLIYLVTFFLGIACGSAIGFALSVVLPSSRSANATITPVLLIMQFFSGVFFPFNGLPAWMRTIADFFPLRWIASGMRAALYPDFMEVVEPSGSFEVGKGLLILTVWTVISVAIALRWFRWLPHEQH